MVTNHLRDDPATTALWRNVRRVGHPRRTRSGVAAPPLTPSAPTPVTPATTPSSAVAPPQTTSQLSVMEKAS
jgi:hypothetical protein